MYFEADAGRDKDLVNHLDYKYHGVKLYGILHFLGCKVIVLI